MEKPREDDDYEKRILSLGLSLAVLWGLMAVTGAAAAAPATLYTGGGAVYATDWTDRGNGVYEGGGALPTPIMPGAAFEGWYPDTRFYDGDRLAPGATPTEGASYYAKWTLPNGAESNGKMAYSLTTTGGTANGIKGGGKLSAFFCDVGFMTAYLASAPASGGGAGDYSGTAIDLSAPDRAVSRQELCLMLYRYANIFGYELKAGEAAAFADADSIPAWSREAVDWAASVGLLQGKTGSLADPAAPCTRAEAATILERFITGVVKQYSGEKLGASLATWTANGKGGHLI